MKLKMPPRFLSFLAVCTCLSVAAFGTSAFATDKTTQRTVEDYDASLNSIILCQANWYHGIRYETIIIKINKHTYRVPDERYSYMDENGHRYPYNDDDQDTYPHGYFLSPDKRWLFVSRKCGYGVEVAYLYHRVGVKRFVAVHHNGLRLDEAAIRYFGDRLHFAPPSFDEARLTEFEGWSKDNRHLLFNLTVDTHPPPGKRGVEIKGSYDLTTGKFFLLSQDTYN
jgi:hypothetical protein